MCTWAAPTTVGIAAAALAAALAAAAIGRAAATRPPASHAALSAIVGRAALWSQSEHFSKVVEV